MTTRRGSQYSIQSDGAGLKGRINPSKGKRKGNIPSGTESTQGSALSQRQVPEIPMISEPELELSMSNSNRYKSHSEVSDRHLHEPVQAVLHSVQRQGLGNADTNTPRSDELLAHPKKVPQRRGNSEILQWMESIIIQTSNQKDEAVPCQKRRRQPRKKPQANPLPQEGKKNKNKNWRKPYSPSYRIPKIQKDAMENVLNMAGILMEFEAKEKQRMR
ncbi:hypothetical protein O181_131240 [Austropuccinia psidii MF-1]|uniref:Uncharacterized protein n=1 Tax=Austropuccinia psidii MF-1 TaxID=1389203 RepID=A0A9Q3L0J1_9BASI|nr:hypothetical protein [Austropuccinia psidii MF-1]